MNIVGNCKLDQFERHPKPFVGRVPDLRPTSSSALCRMKPQSSAAAKLDSGLSDITLGHFCAGKDSSPGHPVFNRAVALRDTWAKIEKKLK